MRNNSHTRSIVGDPACLARCLAIFSAILNEPSPGPNLSIVETYVLRTIILSRANCCLGWCHCIFDLCRFTNQTKYGRAPAQRTQFYDGAMDGDPYGHS